jgi:cytochrome P450/NADPH-cytochrome P450 reductase
MIGFCAFGFRFNNFYTDNPHPFVTQMTEVLTECGKRASRLEIENRLRIFSTARTQENISAMVQLPGAKSMLYYKVCSRRYYIIVS